MKKIGLLFLTTTLILSLFGCSFEEESSKETKESQTKTNPIIDEEEVIEARKLGRDYTFNIEALIKKYDVKTQQDFPACIKAPHRQLSDGANSFYSSTFSRWTNCEPTITS